MLSIGQAKTGNKEGNSKLAVMFRYAKSCTSSLALPLC